MKKFLLGTLGMALAVTSLAAEPAKMDVNGSFKITETEVSNKGIAIKVLNDGGLDYSGTVKFTKGMSKAERNAVLESALGEKKVMFTYSDGETQRPANTFKAGLIRQNAADQTTSNQNIRDLGSFGGEQWINMFDTTMNNSGNTGWEAVDFIFADPEGNAEESTLSWKVKVNDNFDGEFSKTTGVFTGKGRVIAYLNEGQE